MCRTRQRYFRKCFAILIFCLVLTGQAQMLTPFTFHDIQHRVGDFSEKTLQIETSVLPPATSQIGEVSPVSTFQKTSSNSRPTFPRNSSPPISLNPFESSSVANDPSSFVSSLTSLHLHLTKDETASDNRTRGFPTALPNFFQSLSEQNVQSDDSAENSKSSTSGKEDGEDDTDFFSTNFEFPESGFGFKTGLDFQAEDPDKTDSKSHQESSNPEKIDQPSSDQEDTSTGRGFPSEDINRSGNPSSLLSDAVNSNDESGESQSEESRNANFFAQPFKNNFGPNAGLASLGSHNQALLSNDAPYDQEGRENLGRDGGHGGGHAAPIHDGYGPPPVHDGYGAPPVHDGYGAPPVHEVGGYGHVEPIHDDGGYGGDDHHEGGGYSSHPGYTPSRHPGPYGYPTPNFKCEYVKETLYVSKSEWTYDEKCFTIYKTQCKMEYDTGKDIGYKKECNEFSVTKCRTEYDTSSETKCHTIYRKECGQVYVTKVDWEYEEKCETSYEEHCSGYGYEKKCEQVPKEMCHQIPVKVEKQIPKTECKKVPDKKCTDVPIFIPRKACKDFPKTVCVKDPINVPKKIPKKVCYSIPKEVCNKIPVQIIKHVPKTVTKKVCISTKPSGYGHVDAGYSSPHGEHADFSSDVFTIAMPDNFNNITRNDNNNGTTILTATTTEDPSLEELEPEVYYDEVEESDYLEEDEEIFNKAGR